MQVRNSASNIFIPITQIGLGSLLCGFALFLLASSLKPLSYRTTETAYSTKPVIETMPNPNSGILQASSLIIAVLGLGVMQRGLSSFLDEPEDSRASLKAAIEQRSIVPSAASIYQEPRPIDQQPTSVASKSIPQQQQPASRDESAWFGYRKDVSITSSCDGDVTFSSTVEKKNLLPNVELLDLVCNFNGKRAAHHFMLNGVTGDGKSTLAQELVAFLASEFLQGYAIVINPKYMPKDITWGMQAPFVDDINGALEGLQSLNEFMNARKRNTAFEPDQFDLFPPVFCIIEEIDWIASEFGSKATGCLRNLIKVGRAINMIVIVIGQSSLVSSTGLNSSDTRQCSRLILGQEAINFLSNPQNVYSETIKFKDTMIKMQTKGGRFVLTFPTKGAPFLSTVLENKGNEFANLGLTHILDKDALKNILEMEKNYEAT